MGATPPVPIRERRPVAAAAVHPQRGDELVLEVFNSAVGHIDIDVGRTTAYALEFSGAGVLPEMPGIGGGGGLSQGP